MRYRKEHYMLGKNTTGRAMRERSSEKLGDDNEYLYSVYDA